MGSSEGATYAGAQTAVPSKRILTRHHFKEMYVRYRLQRMSVNHERLGF